MPDSRTSRIIASVLVRWKPVDGMPDDAATTATLAEGTKAGLKRYLEEFSELEEVDVTTLAWMDIDPPLARQLTEG
jgi:hypothetical protein